ncbi:hypothetical protein Q4603_08980 [Zobellia galactanivorans]|uniref:hypothetical protein n=1 Tax=Zobellia galactanivorans (strain DSM 12802 / CCUG 47099 / CIP 106680 / NCIMB 13871 / Dsij) TaxID=63186 RepID=UPI0026E354DE|nr:hypothetical protein [Zobellia galactanivorans]MDO6808743.1 hypothetical protein [Zobellia galactanivorans]
MNIDNRLSQFWNWFNSNKAKYEYTLANLNSLHQGEIDEAMNVFEEKLHVYNENIWFRMGGEKPYELLITAEGNVEQFDAVIDLVNSAHTIENWKIIPFIQARDISKFNYRLDDFELTEKDVFFTYTENLSGENGYYLETMFYVTDDKFINDDSFKSSIIRIAETALGEYDFAKIIGFIDVEKVSNTYSEHKSEMLPIYKLKDISESIKNKLRE